MHDWIHRNYQRCHCIFCLEIEMQLFKYYWYMLLFIYSKLVYIGRKPIGFGYVNFTCNYIIILCMHIMLALFSKIVIIQTCPFNLTSLDESNVGLRNLTEHQIRLFRTWSLWLDGDLNRWYTCISGLQFICVFKYTWTNISLIVWK